MYNVGGTGERREECILFFKVHILSNVLYNLKNPHENTVDGQLFQKISPYLEELVNEKKFYIE